MHTNNLNGIYRQGYCELRSINTDQPCDAAADTLSLQGVPGVGKETALKLVAVCKSRDASCDLVERVRQWRDGRQEEGTCITEAIF